jgi:hypothetical protein
MGAPILQAAPWLTAVDPQRTVTVAESGRTDTFQLADRFCSSARQTTFCLLPKARIVMASAFTQNKMTPIAPFRELVKSYGAEVVQFRGLSTISIPCKADRAVDIGFTSRRQSLLAPLLRFPPRFQIAPGVFAYGANAASLDKFISADDNLRAALSLLLSNFRCRVEWSGQVVSVTVRSGVADADATGGTRFLSNLALVAQRLSLISEKCMKVDHERDGYGPAQIRKMTPRATLISALLVVLAAVFWLCRG